MPLTSRLSRITTSGRLIPEIDGLRFVAIAAVVLFHLDGYLRHYTGAPTGGGLTAVALHGKYGVQLFFVISGLLLALPFARAARGQGAPVGLRAYLWRRVTRLEPPYLVNVAVMLAATVAVGGSFAELWPHALASAFYQHGLVYNETPRLSVVLWSLEIEVQFYLLVPFMARAFGLAPRPRRALIVGVALAGGLLHLVPGVEAMRISRTLIYYLPYFGAGFLVADLLTTDLRGEATRRGAWDVVALMGWPLALWATFAEWSAALVLPVLYALVVLAALRGRGARWLFSRPLLTTIGGMCYTIYLYHYLVISLAGRVTRGIMPFASYEANLALQFLIVGGAVLGISAVLFVAIERPCMRRDWPQRLAARLRGTLPAPAPEPNR